MSERRIFKKTEMLTVSEVSRRLGVSRQHIYNLIDRGQSEGGLMAFRFGDKKGLRVAAEEVERFKAACQVTLE